MTRSIIVIYLILLGFFVAHSGSQESTRINENELRGNRLPEQLDYKKPLKRRIARQTPSFHRGINEPATLAANGSIWWSRWQHDEAERIIAERIEEKSLSNEFYEEMWSLAEDVIRSMEKEDAAREKCRSESSSGQMAEGQKNPAVVDAQLTRKEESYERRKDQVLKDPAVLEDYRIRRRDSNKRQYNRLKNARLEDPAVSMEYLKKKREQNERQKQRSMMAAKKDPAVLKEQRRRDRERKKCKREQLKLAGMKDPTVLEAERNRKREEYIHQKQRLEMATLNNAEVLLADRERARANNKRQKERRLQDPAVLEEYRRGKSESNKLQKERLKTERLKDPALLEEQRKKWRESAKLHSERMKMAKLEKEMLESCRLTSKC